MRRGKAQINKSEALRAYFKDHPEATAVQAAAAVSAQIGQTVNSGQAYGVLSTIRKRAALHASSNGHSADGTANGQTEPDLVAQLVELKRVAVLNGGIDETQRRLNLLSQLLA